MIYLQTDTPAQTVYLQLDETRSVVGLLKRGYVVLTANTQFFDVPSITIPNDIIYEP